MRISFNLWEQRGTLIPFFIAVFIITAIWAFALMVISNNEFMLIAKLPESAGIISPILRDTNRLLGIALCISGIIFITCFLWLIVVTARMVGPLRRLTKEASEGDIEQFIKNLNVREKDKLYRLTSILQTKLSKLNQDETT